MLQKKFLDMIFSKITGANFEVKYWDGDQKSYGEKDKENPEFKITLNEKLNFNEIRKKPQLELGEAYMDGKIDLDGDLREVLEVGIKNASKLKDKVDNFTPDKFWERQKEASFEEQKEGIQDHYDLGNDFFNLWQDSTMTYSCAYFKSKDDNLKTAQEQKLEHILKKLNLKKGEKLLDIGCGWGSLAIKAAKEYDVKVLGITLSEEQVKGGNDKITKEGLENQVEIRKEDFRDLAKKNVEFDKIVSVGMFEHVGEEHIPEYFEAVKKMLKEGGLSLLHTITHLEEQPSHPWVEKYIFPWGYIPSLREVIWELPKHKFHLLDAEDIGYHYSLTAERWLNNYEEVTDKVREMFDERFVRRWRIFLAGVVNTFRYADTSVHQILFSNGKNIDLPLTREYIYSD